MLTGQDSASASKLPPPAPSESSSAASGSGKKKRKKKWRHSDSSTFSNAITGSEDLTGTTGSTVAGSDTSTSQVGLNRDIALGSARSNDALADADELDEGVVVQRDSTKAIALARHRSGSMEMDTTVHPPGAGVLSPSAAGVTAAFVTVSNGSRTGDVVLHAEDAASPKKKKKKKRKKRKNKNKEQGGGLAAGSKIVSVSPTQASPTQAAEPARPTGHVTIGGEPNGTLAAAKKKNEQGGGVAAGSKCVSAAPTPAAGPARPTGHVATGGGQPNGTPPAVKKKKQNEQGGGVAGGSKCVSASPTQISPTQATGPARSTGHVAAGGQPNGTPAAAAAASSTSNTAATATSAFASSKKTERKSGPGSPSSKRKNLSRGGAAANGDVGGGGMLSKPAGRVPRKHQEQRRGLPIFAHKVAIVRAVKDHQVRHGLALGAIEYSVGFSGDATHVWY